MVSIRKFYDFAINESAQEADAEIQRKIDQIELKLKGMFNSDTIESGEIKKFGQEGQEKQKTFFNDLNLESLEQSQFSKTYKSLKLIFSDDEFRYDVVFTIKLEEVLPPEGQEFDPESIKECHVEFKRYSLDNGSELVGDYEKKINIEDINEGLFEELLLEVEKNYPTGQEPDEEFSIETE
jgi:hypothetical protein